MTKYTREQYETMPVQYGGDLWNTWKLLNIVFTKTDATSIEYSLGTGLWCYAVINTVRGPEGIRVYENGSVHTNCKY